MFSNDSELRSERIRDFRKLRKVSQQELAIFLDITRTTYQNNEAKGTFKWEDIELISAFFNVSPYFIQYGVEEDELRTLAKILHERGGFHQPTITIFDDLSKHVEDSKLYVSYLNLPKSDQMRIKRYVESQGY